MTGRAWLSVISGWILISPLRAEEPWAGAAGKPAMTAEETRTFMIQLLDSVSKHHLKRDPKSEQRGMVYEYFDVQRAGQFDQWVQGEALDTMHDGAWLAVAMTNAARATGDPRYRQFLTEWQLPFYTKMLNHSDTLFSTKQVDVAENGVRFGKEHALQAPEKGFVPYWWDDGASVSLERRRSQDPRVKPPFACTDRLAGKENPQARLDGYSHGSSNHLAQNLAVMVQQSWLLLRKDPPSAAMVAELAKAARHLHECRLRHHGLIPGVAAAAALCNNDAELMKRVPGLNPKQPPHNHFTRFLAAVGTTQRQGTPAFADDTQYVYYTALAKYGVQLPVEVRLKVIYDAYTEPMLFRYWWDNGELPAGINRFDLTVLGGSGGRFDFYRSDRPVPLGSRFGPQNLVCCGWAAQMLRQEPTLWDDAVKRLFPDSPRVPFLDPANPAVMDGRPEPDAVRVLDELGVRLDLCSERNALIAAGEFAGNEFRLQIGMPGDQAPFAEITIERDDERISARNHRGNRLLISGKVVPSGGDDRTRFEFALPYTVTKGQETWGNGYEFGMLRVNKTGSEPKTIVLASPGALVRKSLEKELAQGLRNWEAIFRARGYIPTSLFAGPSWDRFSDSGGYAHLISAASQYLLLLADERDWESTLEPKKMPEK